MLINENKKKSISHRGTEDAEKRKAEGHQAEERQEELSTDYADWSRLF